QTAPASPSASSRSGSEPIVEIVVPVYNEARALAASIRQLHDFLTSSCDFGFQITIADNASTDRTLAVARALCGELAGVHALHLDDKGRGLALRASWGVSDA